MKVFKCHNCGEEIEWGGSSMRGSIIYECDYECGNYICTGCMYENKDYRKQFNESSSFLGSLDKIPCLDCFNSMLERADLVFDGWLCNLEIGKYVDSGNTYIALIEVGDGSPVALATVDFGEKLAENQAYIKQYSENEGMLDALSKAGLINRILGYKKSGYVQIPLCELNLKS